jgi:DNA-binding transcriptional LysR family regulator
MIDRQSPLSIVRQCKLLGLSRAGLYRFRLTPSASKLDLMKRIDKLHMAYPYMGSRSIQDQSNRQGQNLDANHGYNCGVSKASNDDTEPGAYDLSLPASSPCGDTTQ